MKKIFIAIVIIFCTTYIHAQTAKPADTIMEAAYAKAKMEKKNVFLIFHASWCGWCKKMDASINDKEIKKYFDDNFVIVQLVVQESDDKKVLENPGAEELNKNYKGDKQGLPFFVILNTEGKVLENSYGQDGNIGCPASEEEVNIFISKLKSTSRINKEGLELIRKRFRKNEK